MTALPREAPKDSLLLGNGTQLALLADQPDDIPDGAFARNESRGIFTADRLFQQNPRLYHAVVKLLGRAETFRSIADILCISPNTVRAVRDREQVSIDTEKVRIGQVAMDVSRLSFEALLGRLTDPDQLGKIKATELAIIAGIATEKAQLLAGAPTAIIGNQDMIGPGHEEYLKLIATVKNVTPIGSGVETRGTKEAAPQLAAPAAHLAIDVAATPVQPPERAGP